MLDVDEWSELVDDPGGPAWKSEQLGQQISGPLGTDHLTFIEVAKRLHTPSYQVRCQPGLKMSQLA